MSGLSGVCHVIACVLVVVEDVECVIAGWSVGVCACPCSCLVLWC